MIISTAKQRNALQWRQREITWQGFCDRCAKANWVNSKASKQTSKSDSKFYIRKEALP